MLPEVSLGRAELFVGTGRSVGHPLTHSVQALPAGCVNGGRKPGGSTSGPEPLLWAHACVQREGIPCTARRLGGTRPPACVPHAVLLLRVPSKLQTQIPSALQRTKAQAKPLSFFSLHVMF